MQLRSFRRVLLGLSLLAAAASPLAAQAPDTAALLAAKSKVRTTTSAAKGLVTQLQNTEAVIDAALAVARQGVVRVDTLRLTTVDTVYLERSPVVVDTAIVVAPVDTPVVVVPVDTPVVVVPPVVIDLPLPILSDSVGLVQFSDDRMAAIIGPQVSAGGPLNPWPWFDQTAIRKGIQHGEKFPTSPPYLSLSGTVEVVPGTLAAIGTGTKFTEEIAADEYFFITGPDGKLTTTYVYMVVNDTLLYMKQNWSGTPEKGLTVRTAKGEAWDEFENRNYYDQGLVQYTNFYRTGDVRYLSYARKITDSWWQGFRIDQGHTAPENAYAPRTSSLGGLMLRALDGRPEMWPWITEFVRLQYDGWIGARLTYPAPYYGVRDGGYTLLYTAWLAQVHPDSAVRAEFTEKARKGARDYYARLQFPDGSWRWLDEDWPQPREQPFMVGVLLEGMIATHRITGDTAVARAIVKSVENLYTSGYRKDEVVQHLTSVNWRGMFYFLHGDCEAGCGRNWLDGGWDTNGIREVRQLSTTIVHAFGYAYQLTRDPKYRAWGDEVFAAAYGSGSGPLSDPFSSLADFREKEYDEAFRSAGHYLAERNLK